jgi:hypothetical protein
VAWATKALDTVRRQVWQQRRRVDPDAARQFKGARWCLLRNPTDLSPDQAATLRKLRRQGGALWRAYSLKEALRAVFSGDLGEAEVSELLDRFCSKASRSGLKPFITLDQIICKRRVESSPPFRLGVNNARHEGLNGRVRLITKPACGFQFRPSRSRPDHVHPRTRHPRPTARTGLRTLKWINIHAGGPHSFRHSNATFRKRVVSCLSTPLRARGAMVQPRHAARHSDLRTERPDRASKTAAGDLGCCSNDLPNERIPDGPSNGSLRRHEFEQHFLCLPH